MASEERKMKHLDIIQLTMTRMAANSFLLKAWSVTLVAALFALASKDTTHNYLSIVYFVVAAFWFLDGYYLSQERLYRELYDAVRTTDEQNIDFSMHTKKFKVWRKNSWFVSLLGRTNLLFYGSILVVIAYVNTRIN